MLIKAPWYAERENINEAPPPAATDTSNQKPPHCLGKSQRFTHQRLFLNVYSVVQIIWELQFHHQVGKLKILFLVVTRLGTVSEQSPAFLEKFRNSICHQNHVFLLQPLRRDGDDAVQSAGLNTVMSWTLWEAQTPTQHLIGRSSSIIEVCFVYRGTEGTLKAFGQISFTLNLPGNKRWVKPVSWTRAGFLFWSLTPVRLNLFLFVYRW